MPASAALPPPLIEEMPPWRLYLGLRGRVTRRTFWLHGVLALLVGGVVGVALLEIAGVHPDRAEKWASLMIAWPAIAISAKRWHDRNRAGWWALIVLIPIPVIPQLWALIDNGFVPSTKGPNRFGDQPTR
ncbi:MAG TPA: DUF805 domain-containing protein [Ideonella sp.]|nr:DUF805 domain-containing protein [Ideonella sp.]